MMAEKGQAPTHNVLVFDSNGYATTVGAAWPTKDGKGVTCRLLPGVALTGQFAILKRRERKDERSDNE